MRLSLTKAIVLNGCGALGAWQAGAVSALMSRDGMAESLYGISSGSLNAFLFGYLGPLKAIEFWHEIDSFGEVFKLNWKFWKSDGLFKLNTKFVKQFRHDIIAKSFPSTTVNIWTMRAEDGTAKRYSFVRGRTDNNACDTAISSICIPGVVQSHNGETDAGFRLLCPLKAAIEDGHDDITLISGRPIDAIVPRPRLPLPTAAAAYQVIDVALSEILRRDIAECQFRNTILGYRPINLKIIQPDYVLGGPLDFKQCKNFLKAGQKHVFDGIKFGRI
jgi:predicted acylesterase/phospholipase RssA